MTARYPRAALLGPLLAAGLAATLSLPAAARAQHAGDAARVNGAAISNERADRFLVDYLSQKGRNAQAIRHPEAYRQYRREALEQLVDDELLWQEASRLGLVATPAQVGEILAEGRARHAAPGELARRLERAGLTLETWPEWARRQASIRNLLARRLGGLSVTDAEVHAHWEGHPETYTEPLELRIRHVLRQVDSGAPAADRARARAEADEVRRLALSGKDLGALARKRSQDSSASSGGDLGWVRRGTMVPEFEAVAFALADGEISGVVETVYGFHVVQVQARRGGERIPEARVRESIRAELLAARRTASVQDLVDDLRAKAKIEYAEPR
ncbi:MAG TPA: peptidylprolyl isomerase [Anaeromyxobacteraceae bacterium]|nr:peptidylprolyl isomerase [Anaeromyxobacteraceae bacterium]